LIWGLISPYLVLLHAPSKVSAQTCDEYKFNVSACMLYEGSDTMAACQSCLVGGLNVLQGLVPNPQVSSTSSTSSELASSTNSTEQCDKASGVLCQILELDCRDSCLVTACYNTTTLWAACIADTYDLPDCNVTCPNVLRNISATNNNSTNGGGGGGTSHGTSWRAVGDGGASIVGALIVSVAWGGLAAMVF
jgi:hypothetical protein